MQALRTFSLAALAAVTLASPASAQTPVRFSVIGGMSLPIGDLGNSSNLGLNIGVRGEGRAIAPGWSWRGDLGYDRFGGRNAVDYYSYTTVAANLVHRENGGTWYEFGGLGLYASTVAFTSAVNRSDANLGMQLGGGLDLTSDHKVFLEGGLASAFTSGRSSLWFPVRVGFRF